MKMDASVVGCFVVLALVGSLQAGEKIIFGTQAEPIVELKGSYIVNAEYIIPKGFELRVCEGTTIVFLDNVGLSVSSDAKLTVSGTSGKPVIFKGKSSGIGAWTGIRMENSAKVDICGAVVMGAKIGLRSAWGSTAVIRKSVFTCNEKGVCFWENNGQMEDCVLTKNKDLGAQVHYGPSTFDHCTISENGKGIGGWGSARLIACRLSGNNGNGIDCSNGKSTATECLIENNRGFDVVCPGGVWDFGKNYWGVVATRMLMQKGPSANLPKVKDKLDGHREGIVDLTDFLTKPPADCGARDYPGCKKSKLNKDEPKNTNEPKKSEQDAPDEPADGNEETEVDFPNPVEEQEPKAEGLAALQEPLFVKPMSVPDAVQIEKAAKIARELCEDDTKALKAGSLKGEKFALKLIGYSGQTENAAVKFVLLRNAFRQFLMAGDIKNAQALFDRAFDKFGGRFAAEMANYSSSTLRKLANSPKLSKSVKQLLTLVEESMASCKAIAEAEADLKKRSSDMQAKLKLALHAVELQDWELALKTYAEIDGKRRDVCRWEIKALGADEKGFTCEQAGDFWWESVDGKNEQGLLFRSVSRHAAYWYRKALAEEKMTELKSALVKKRIAKARGL